MPEELDLETWKRKSQYEFFKDYDNPFFYFFANVDATNLYQYTKKHKLSFFLSCLFLSLKTANEIFEFRLRIEGEKIIIYDTLDAGSTILNDDETFLFTYFNFNQDIKIFCEEGLRTIEKQKTSKILDGNVDKQDLIYHSVIPWISFTSISNAQRFGKSDGIPKIVFGKYFEEGGRKKMPISVEVHHALMDGLHVGRYFQNYQKNIDSLQNI